MSSDVGGEPHQHQPASGVCKVCQGGVSGVCLRVCLGPVWGVFGVCCLALRYVITCQVCVLCVMSVDGDRVD